MGKAGVGAVVLLHGFKLDVLASVSSDDSYDYCTSGFYYFHEGQGSTGGDDVTVAFNLKVNTDTLTGIGLGLLDKLLAHLGLPTDNSGKPGEAKISITTHPGNQSSAGVNDGNQYQLSNLSATGSISLNPGITIPTSTSVTANGVSRSGTINDPSWDDREPITDDHNLTYTPSTPVEGYETAAGATAGADGVRVTCATTRNSVTGKVILKKTFSETEVKFSVGGQEYTAKFKYADISVETETSHSWDLHVKKSTTYWRRPKGGTKAQWVKDPTRSINPVVTDVSS